MAWHSEGDLVRWFAGRRPDEAQGEALAELRRSAYQFARTVLRVCPPCGDQSAAVRQVREALATASSAVLCGPRGVAPGADVTGGLADSGGAP